MSTNSENVDPWDEDMARLAKSISDTTLARLLGDDQDYIDRYARDCAWAQKQENGE